VLRKEKNTRYEAVVSREKKNISTYKKGKERNPKVYVPTCRLMERSGKLFLEA